MDALYFALNLNDYSLPYLHPTGGRVCYYQTMEICDSLTPVMGILSRDSVGVHPTMDQCCLMFRAEWRFVNYWFTKMFPAFTAPLGATEFQIYTVKTVLRKWFLQFGPDYLNRLAGWKQIVTIFNSASLNWTRLLAWPGKYLANGVTYDFPAELATLTASSPELKLFNTFSTVCNTAGCGYKTQCQTVASTSLCATS
jgi:hypothetical protein